MPAYRNRIKSFRTVNARDIRENPENFRRHGQEQAGTLKALFEEVGVVDVLKCVETDDGELMLVDGHLRRDLIGSGTVQVAVLDLDERERKQVLAAFDPIGGMADTDSAALDALLQSLAETPLVAAQEAAVATVLDAIGNAESPDPADYDTAQRISSTAADHLRNLAERDPHLLAQAQAIIVATGPGRECLVLTDPDLGDIIRELRLRHEQGETHPLDRLFAAIWEPGSAAGATGDQ
jgi:hypothetical protein